jgi:micrococcal nuclease
VDLERERSCSASKSSPRATAGTAGKRALIGLLAFLISSCARASDPVVVAEPAASTTSSPGAPIAAIQGPVRRGALPANAVVRRSVDGDTVEVSLLNANDRPNTSSESVRLIGIDTPETKRPDTPIECFGKKASAAIAALLPPGTLIHLERDVEERDRYGRLLAYIFRSSDGLFINHELVRTGFAASYPYPPNVAYADSFRAAAEVAQVVGVGLWGACGDPHVPAG